MKQSLTEILEQLQDMDLVSERGDTWRKSDIKQAEQAINAYIAEVIDFPCDRPQCDCRWIKEEQRKRAGLSE